MKFPSFSYIAPASLQEVLRVLADDPDARIIAGGQSLLPLLAFRLVYPSWLVDLRHVSELFEISQSDGLLSIGAMVTHNRNKTDPTVAKCVPILPKVLAHVAHQAVRNRGTLGGSLAHADAGAEMPFLMATLGATMYIASPAGVRSVSATDFMKGHYYTDLEEGEVLVRIEIPFSKLHWEFDEFARRKGDYALVMVAAGLSMQGGRCVEAQVALGAVEETAHLATRANEFLIGKVIDEATVAEAAELAVEGLKPRSDIHGSRELRLSLAKAIAQRVILKAAQGALYAGA
ncbi:xanthine dehydrogenase family protein subunit M [Pseudomonas sp. 5Ae-yellow]|uniref:FAD binding domain-containing protein n=1 Tax=Pseudomonas sp. 5Ae-yellow TaxID=2759848 RepID=UPI0015F3B2A5|nr:xanthine dehydrogenase family protein subunit M [Pseudomonas sp. 5Ae-yellow]MBA6420986.1 xanthine dehydrogenase family protein subunit M [Pseudomonas sp. 5Ae-yellow]